MTAVTSANGASWTMEEKTENVTLSTTGDRSPTSSDFLESGTIIRCVVAKVITTIGTIDPPVVKFGDLATVSRFGESASGFLWAANEKIVFPVTTLQKQSSDAALYITVADADFPNVGQVAVTIFFDRFTAPS